MGNLQKQDQKSQEVQQIDLQHVEWIAGRVQVLLSHYYQPNMPEDKAEAAIDDWVDVLAAYSQDKIQKACLQYIEKEPYKRPTPGVILRMIDDKRTWRDKPQSEWTHKDRQEHLQWTL